MRSRAFVALLVLIVALVAGCSGTDNAQIRSSPEHTSTTATPQAAQNTDIVATDSGVHAMVGTATIDGPVGVAPVGQSCWCR